MSEEKIYRDPDTSRGLKDDAQQDAAQEIAENDKRAEWHAIDVKRHQPAEVIDKPGVSLDEQKIVAAGIKWRDINDRRDNNAADIANGGGVKRYVQRGISEGMTNQAAKVRKSKRSKKGVKWDGTVNKMQTVVNAKALKLLSYNSIEELEQRKAECKAVTKLRKAGVLPYYYEDCRSGCNLKWGG